MGRRTIKILSSYFCFLCLEQLDSEIPYHLTLNWTSKKHTSEEAYSNLKIHIIPIMWICTYKLPTVSAFVEKCPKGQAEFNMFQKM